MLYVRSIALQNNQIINTLKKHTNLMLFKQRVCNKKKMKLKEFVNKNAKMTEQNTLKQRDSILK